MKKLALGLSAIALVAAGTAYAHQHRGPNADADGDGVVTRAEAQTHAGMAFSRMDANSDGKLDSTDRDFRREQFRAKKFEALDANSDGQISREEFMAFDHMGDRGKHHRMGRYGQLGRTMMRMADTNNDGSISQAEFTAAALKHFDHVDTDSDGKITQEERQAARKEMRGKWRETMRDRPES